MTQIFWLSPNSTHCMYPRFCLYLKQRAHLLKSITVLIKVHLYFQPSRNNIHNNLTFIIEARLVFYPTSLGLSVIFIADCFSIYFLELNVFPSVHQVKLECTLDTSVCSRNMVQLCSHHSVSRSEIRVGQEQVP